MSGRDLLRAAPRLRRCCPPGPDWLEDALALASAWAPDWGPRARGPGWRLRWIDRHLVRTARRHPPLAAGVPALAFGLLVATAQALGASYPAAGFLLLLIVFSAGMFALLALTGAYLELAGPGAAARTRLPRAAVDAAGPALAGSHWGGLFALLAMAAATAAPIGVAAARLQRPP